MNTNTTPHTALATGQVIHTSQRSAMSENVLPNGERVRTIESSRLEMKWVAGDLQVCCQVSRVNLPGAMQTPRSVPRARRM
jgi:hypothetical protein